MWGRVRYKYHSALSYKCFRLRPIGECGSNDRIAHGFAPEFQCVSGECLTISIGRALPCPWRHFGGVVATIADAAGRDLGSARASLSSTRAAERPGHGIHGSLAAVPPEGVVRRRVRRRMTISNRAPCGSTRGSRLTWLVVGTFARTGPEVSHWTASPRARLSPSSVSPRATAIVVAGYRIQE